MGKIEIKKKKKGLRKLLIIVVSIVLVICLLYLIILPVRGNPEMQLESFGEIESVLNNTDFILPSKELLPNVELTYFVAYTANRVVGNVPFLTIFSAQGLFADKGKYEIRSLPKFNAATNKDETFSITATRFDYERALLAKNKLIIERKIDQTNGVKVTEDETGFAFTINDIIYSVSKSAGYDELSLSDLEKIANDIIARVTK